MSNVSRRALLTTSIAGLAIASTGCPPEDDPTVPKHRVNLICSGMMAFYWNKTDDKLTILIPPPAINGKPIHQIRFGGLIGTELQGGRYQLKLGDCQGPGPNNQPHSSDADPKNEALFRLQGSYPIPQPGKIYCWIEIPKPTSVRLARPITKKDSTKQFFCGRDADAFNIKPDTLPAFYVLTYDGVEHLPLFTGGGRSIRFAEGGKLQNLHLYAEPPKAGTMQDHIELFTNMFTAADGSPLDVTHDSSCNPTEGSLTDLALTTVPDDLCRYDLATLAELDALPSDGSLPHIEVCNQPRCTPLNVADPAGCIDGWVDGAQSPY